MSRLRWPDSTNSVSDVPGTIQYANKLARAGAVKRLPADRGPPTHAGDADDADPHVS